MYSFVAFLISKFIDISRLPDIVELIASILLMSYFVSAIISYIFHGCIKKIKNQLNSSSPAISFFMWSLIIAETGAFSILFYGVLAALI